MRNRLLICATMPGLAMVASHYFPWRQSIGRDLPRLAAYAIGTTGIVATAASAIATDTKGRGPDHAALLLTATASAGAATILCWLWDHVLHLTHQIAEAGAYNDALTYVRRPD